MSRKDGDDISTPEWLSQQTESPIEGNSVNKRVFCVPTISDVFVKYYLENIQIFGGAYWIKIVFNMKYVLRAFSLFKPFKSIVPYTVRQTLLLLVLLQLCLLLTDLTAIYDSFLLFDGCSF